MEATYTFSSESEEEILSISQAMEHSFYTQEFQNERDSDTDLIQFSQMFDHSQSIIATTSAQKAVSAKVCDAVLHTSLEIETQDSASAARMFEPPITEYEDISDDEVQNETRETERVETSKMGSASKKQKLPCNDRFGAPLSEKEIQDMAHERIPPSTRNKALWAVTLFGEWRGYRNIKALENPEENLVYLNKPLMQMTNEEINYSLTRFVTEVKKNDGTDYPGKTLREMVCSIQKQFDMNGRVIKLLGDPAFKTLQDTLDCIMKTRASLGIGMEKKQAEVISKEQEDTLWKTGLLGDHSPQSLLDTQIFIFGLNFALRGGEEHRKLKPSQIKLLTMPSGEKYLEYTEEVSKTNSGGLHCKREPKITQAFENRSNPERCPVRLYELYNAKCPKDRPPDCYYLRPRQLASDNPESHDVWYCNVPVGKNTLAKVVATLCEKAGFKGFFTNHSLRATSATRLYDAGVDEQLICEKTGHKSNAVRSYKRTSTEQKQHVSAIVQGAKKNKASTGNDEQESESKKIKISINFEIN